jgi:flavin reductase (DIM6/NTAB) family NADH-FMN oxidoreductase RutF
MIIDPKTLPSREVYRLLTSAVVPRPIAFITSVNADGRINAAPYSFFNAITSSPPLLMVSAERKKGQMKHTSENILREKEFVVNIVTGGMLEAMNAASADFHPESSAFEQSGLTLAPCAGIKTPRIREAPVSLECILHRHLEIGLEPADVILGEIVRFHVVDELYLDGTIDSRLLRPIARMGGKYYTEAEQLFELEQYRGPKTTP